MTVREDNLNDSLCIAFSSSKGFSSIISLAGVTAVMVDALDLKAVEGALDGCDAAITTLGGAPGEDEAKRVDYAGNRNVIESAGILGVTRVILVTSLGCGTSREALSDEVSLGAMSLQTSFILFCPKTYAPTTSGAQGVGEVLVGKGQG